MALAHHDHDTSFDEQAHQTGAQPPQALEGAQDEADVVGMQLAGNTQVLEPGADKKPFDPTETVSYTAEEMAALRAQALHQQR
jgi:hypothetical protein